MNKTFIKQLVFALIILAVLTACTGQSKAQSLTQLPVDWPTSTPEQQGMDSTLISKVFDAIQALNQTIHGVLIVRNGTIVTEANVAPFRPDASQNIITTTESIVSTLVGIAIQDGYIKGLDQKMLDFFPDRKIAYLTPTKRSITIKDLLTETAGFSVDDDGVAASDDWVQYQLDLPMVQDPGYEFALNRGVYILLTAILQKATGMTALAYANKVLFAPLGISDVVWETDAQGIENGGNRLYLTSRDMAKIGYLYLNDGVWKSKQIVPKAFVIASTKKQFDIPDFPGWGIGYGWWIVQDGSFVSEIGSGSTQLVFVKPDQGLITVFTGGYDGITSNEVDLFYNGIVPAIKSSKALPKNPAGVTLLNTKITMLEKPTPQAIPPLPKVSQTISGKKYLLDDGEVFKLTFNGDQAMLDWSLKDHNLQLPIGLDGVYRTTPVDQTDRLSPFGADPKTLTHGFVALRGEWTFNNIFDLTMQFLNTSRRQTVSFTFAGNEVNILQTNPNGGDIITVSFHGQVQVP